MFVKAKLVKKETSDGLFVVRDNVEVGKVYLIDPKTKRKVKFFNTVYGVNHEKEVVDVQDDLLNIRFFPMELLEVIHE